MITSNLFNPTDSHKVVDGKGRFSVIEYERDMSVSASNAQAAYFASKMNVRKRQVIAHTTEEDGIIVQAGAMQMMLGQVNVSTNVKSAGDFFKKFAGSKVTGETTIKPYYIGEGTVVLEPTYKYIILEDLSEWQDAMVIEDGMFLACEDTVEVSVKARDSMSSAIMGGEGLFNTTLSGSGIVVMESIVPADELIVIDMEDDELKLDGNFAIAWSYGIKFTVERTTKTLIGSAVSKEGFVNVYRGTGRVLVAPVQKDIKINNKQK